MSAGARVLSARSLLLKMAGAREERSSLQAIGQSIDQRTNGRWLAYALLEQLEGNDGLLVVDAVRTVRQTLPALEAVVGSRLVYLDASEQTRRRRYSESAKIDVVKAHSDFDISQRHQTERNVPALKPLAHLVIETDDLSLDTTCDEIRRALDVDRPSGLR